MESFAKVYLVASETHTQIQFSPVLLQYARPKYNQKATLQTICNPIFSFTWVAAEATAVREVRTQDAAASDLDGLYLIIYTDFCPSPAGGTKVFITFSKNEQ